MKTVKSITTTLLLTGLLTQPALAGSLNMPAKDSIIQGAFGQNSSTMAAVNFLSEKDMATTKGQFGPLLLTAVAIAGVDLALISVFWGIYVPNYGSGAAACANCSDRKITQH